MKKLLSMLLATAMMLGCLAGCGNSSEPSGSGSSGAQTEQTQGDESITVGVTALTTTFNFWATASMNELVLMQSTYDTLLYLDENGEYQPGLAESWDISEDGLTYTFHLRQGVKFSDGSEFTSDDIRFSLETCMQNEGLSWLYQSMIAGIDTPDDYTVSITTPEINNQLLVILSNPGYTTVMSRAAHEKYGDSYGTSPESVVGTGPYYVSEWKYKEYLTMEANEEHFLGAPAIKKIVIKPISDPNSAVVALQTGEIDLYLGDVPGVSIEDIKNSDKVSLVEYTSMNSISIYMNNQTGMFADPNMRKAVGYAVNKEEYLLVGNEGHGMIINYPGDQEGALVADPQVDKVWYEQDLEKAKQLVKEAGNEGKDVVIYCTSTDPYPALATMLQSTLSSIGLNATIEQLERTQFNDKVIKNADYEIMVTGSFGSLYDIDEPISSLASGNWGSGSNYAYYANDEMDQLILDGRATHDLDERVAIYTDLVELFNEDLPTVPLYYAAGNRAFSNRIKLVHDNLVQRDLFRYYTWAD